MEYSWGLLSVLAASIAWGIAPAIIKIGVRSHVDARAFNAVRVFVAAPIIALILLFSNEPFTIPASIYGWIAVLAASLLGPGLGDIAYIYSIREIGGGRAVTIGYTYILISQFLAVILLREQPGVQLFLGSIIALIGVWLVAQEAKTEAGSKKGVVAALVASGAWGLGSIANKYALFYVGPLTLSFLRILILIPLMVFLGYRSLRSLDRRAVSMASITGVLSYGFGIPLFLYAISTVGVSVTVLVTALAPVLGKVFSVLLAKETLIAKGIIGTLVTVIGIVVGVIG